MKIYFYILIFLLPISTSSSIRAVLPAPDKLGAVIDTASSYVGVKEKTGSNDGKEVEMFLNSVGLKKGNPWCQAFIYYCFKANYKKPPIPRSAMAQSSFNYALKHGIKTPLVLKPGDLIIWKKASSWSGHVGLIDSVGKGGWVQTIEGNTSNGKTGSQREGNGVFKRLRNYFHPLSRYVFTRGFVGFYRKIEDV